MFADVSGSSALFERLGDTEAMHAVDRCLKRMSRSIEGYKGKTTQVVGDELLAIFATPEDACLAAIDMQQRIADLPPVSGLKLSIRIGLHGGDVVEVAGKPTGLVVDTAARIAGQARRNEILCSSTLLNDLPIHAPVHAVPMPELGNVKENGETIGLYQVQWVDHEVSVYPHSTFGAAPSTQAGRLSLRYKGRIYYVDLNAPLLTAGRDLGNGLVVEDRKASRQHARIEHRPDGFHLVDTSTNGTYVSSLGRPEFLVRRKETRLDGRGQLCFGGSINDPETTRIDFEVM